MDNIAGRYGLQDASLNNSIALPAAPGTVTSAVLDTGTLTGLSAQLAECEALLSAPVLTTAQLPDGKTATYSVMGGATADALTSLVGSAIVQTGAGGAGAAAATYRFKLPSNCPRYLAVQVVTGALAGDCHLASAALQLLF
jgi:hypothetical protein